EGSHRIKNHLQVLSGLVELQLAEGKEMVPARELERLRSQIQALSFIHDFMTLTTKESAENYLLPAKPLLERVLSMLERSTTTHRIDYAVEAVVLPIKAASSLVLALNELVSNAIKHGKGVVRVTFGTERGEATLEVIDDGPGFPDGFDSRMAANTGLELVEAVAGTDLGGRVVYGSGPGGRVLLAFPLPMPREQD
ncbi:MAG: sensor histidine kinase, partial [Capsulimonadales bacterium]|nr:sensor histidine kinase [Capsulimonadales bacterium]